MLSAINAPKSKSISISFLALKSMVLGLIFCSAFEELSNDKCTTTLYQLSYVLKVFYILGCTLDTFALIYFYCTNDFSRLEYYDIILF